MPFVEPANRLVERGHEVTYLAPAGYHQQLAGERFQLAEYPLDMSSRAMHADAKHERLLRHPTVNSVRLPRYWLRKAYVSDPDAVRSALVASLTGADVAVVHTSMSALVGPVAESLGLPVVVGHLFPMGIPSREWTFPVDWFPFNLGPRVNRAMWSTYTAAVGTVLYDRQVNALRRSFGLPPRRGNFLTAWLDADRIVVLISPRYYSTETPDSLPVTWAGFCHWAGPSPHRALDPDVEAYLDAGEPPVLVTLGSSAATQAGPRFAAIASALDEMGLRSLLLVGNRENLDAVADRDGAFEFAPLAPVLARCRAAVTSGSLGTTAAAMAAGVPVVVVPVPQLLDQKWYGLQAQRLGVGLQVRRVRDVPGALARIEADPGYVERARALARAMAAEDGPGTLADEVESVLAR